MDELLDRAPCGFVSFLDDGKVEQVNTTLLEMLGYDREVVEGAHIERLFTVGSRIFYQTHWFPLLRFHGHAEEIFLMLRGKGGEEIGALVNAIRRDGQHGPRYDCIVMRVRERQKFEDELLRARRHADEARAEVESKNLELEDFAEELRTANEALQTRTEEAEHLRARADGANRAKSQFLANMSHELRTPLNAIGGYVELLQMGIHGPVTEAQREVLERVLRSERHLLRLINEVLNLARIEAGQVKYEIEAIRVRGLVSEIIPMVEPQARSKSLVMSVDVPADLAARADREKAQQILLNLLSNALKFTEPGGLVGVKSEVAEDSSDHLMLRISDTGVGIPPHMLESVFSPFVQVDEKRDREAEGTGLGLAISRDLARGMGGDLFAESELGRGSTFTLILPRAR